MHTGCINILTWINGRINVLHSKQPSKSTHLNSEYSRPEIEGIANSLETNTGRLLKYPWGE